jgi:hypothetical protein
MSLRPVPIHKYSIHHCHHKRLRLRVSVYVIFSEWIAEFVPFSASLAIRGLPSSPIYPSPDILVRKE